MKFIKRNLSTVFCFIVGALIVSVCINFGNSDCEAIRQLAGSGLGEFVISVVKIIGIGLTGIVLFLLIKKHINQHYYKHIKLLYFALLPFGMCVPQLITIPANMKYKEVIQSICDKSIGDGMTFKSRQLSKKEYDYLVRIFYIIPELPATAREIDIKYYHDDFLGDYGLKIDFECELNEKIDTLSPGKHWSLYERNLSGQTMKVEYNDSRN